MRKYEVPRRFAAQDPEFRSFTVTRQGETEPVTVEAPAGWSQNAVSVFASHYMRVVNGARESSVRQSVERVSSTIARWAWEDGYFGADSEEARADGEAFAAEMRGLLYSQTLTFNSPVWYNVGIAERPQCSACYIQRVDDDMEDIIALQASETRLFKRGSGTGTNLSTLRPAGWPLSGGGSASGPASFMRGYDAWAGVTKSGGETRRAAKGVWLDCDHPDIEQFVEDKREVEGMARDLVAAGHSGDWNGKVAKWLPFQNANHSVRATDAFMRAVADDAPWDLSWGGKVVKTVRARDLWGRICRAAAECGDPGIQFHDTINSWHTSPSGGQQRATNPCQPASATVLVMDPGPGQAYGIRTFADIGVGSVIWSGKQWTAVTAKASTGRKRVLRYRTTAGSFIGTEEHRIIQNGERCEVRDAESIDQAIGPRCTDTSKVDLQDVVDGWTFGDGSVHRASGDRVYLTLGQDDVAPFREECGAYIERERPGLGYGAYEVRTTISAQELPYTYQRAIPARFLRGDRRRVRGFLRGLYAANGSVCGGRVTLKASSLAVIDAVQQMLSSLGIPSYYTTNKPSWVEFSNGEYECRQSYDLNITHGRRDFAELIGFVHQSKRDRLSAACAGKPSAKVKRTYEIVEVEDLGEDDVFDITVEADEHTYWTGGLLVSNCSEFSYIDDSACNLAHLILQRFLPAAQDEPFDAAAMRDAVRVAILAQDVIVDRSSYPTPEIAANSLKYRPLGLGYAGLGALLMRSGMAYDSDEGRAVAAVVTSLLAASAWEASAELAAVRGRFDTDERDAAATRTVLLRHAGAHAASSIPGGRMNSVWYAAKWTWRNAVESYEVHGVRNGQFTLLAPTGTCGLAADCDSTGCEPYFAPVTYKSLAGGGGLKIAVESTDAALRVLGYEESDRRTILAHVAEHERFDDAPHLRPNHLPVFDCAIPGKGGARCISPEAHVRMMAAVQPFLSGAISKTVNLPRGSSPDVVGRVYELAWRLGVKTIALYVDGSKFSQPISTGAGKAKVAPAAPPSSPGSNDGASIAPPQRRRLPQDRRSATRHFEIGGVDGYITVGFYDDGGVGEVFTKLGKAGDTIGGLLDAWAITFSTALQYGVPLAVLVAKGEGADFSPNGFTGDDLRAARSVVDYVCRYLRRFLPEGTSQVADSPTAFSNAGPIRVAGPPCTAGTGCHGSMARRGACMQCDACGHRSGCGA